MSSRHTTRFIVLFFAIFAMIAASGCSFFGGIVGGAGGGEMTPEEFNEFMTGERIEPWENTGSPSLDNVGSASYILAEQTFTKTKNYIQKCDASDTWNAYQNDIAACQAENPGEETDCVASVNAKLTPDQRAEIARFTAANSSAVLDMIKDLAAVANLTSQVNDAAKNRDLGTANLMTFKNGLGQLQNQVGFLVQTQQYFNTQKATMDAFEEHGGR